MTAVLGRTEALPENPSQNNHSEGADEERKAIGPKDVVRHAGQADASRRRRYTRTPQAGPLAISAEQVLLLRFLSQCRFLSLPQLARLAALPEKGARRRLRTLFDAGLVDVIPVSRVALAPPDAPNDASLLFGSAPNIYAPTAAGLKLASQEGRATGGGSARKAPVYGPRNGLFLAHELAVRDVRVWLEAVRRELGGVPQVTRWQVGPEATIGGGETDPTWSARPDAWFVCELTEGVRPVVLVGLAEVDRATERGDRHWGAKLAGYHALFEERDALTAATGYVNARVLVFTPTAHRRDRLAALLLELVQEARLPSDLVTRFWLAEHTALSRTDLTESVWRRPGIEALAPLVPSQMLPPKTSHVVPG